MGDVRAQGVWLALFLAIVTPFALAQDGVDPAADIQKQLESIYPLTKATPDDTDIVTAGAVLVLQKDNLQMCKVKVPIPTRNFYRNGALTQGGVANFFNDLSKLTEDADPSLRRKFVAGMKFWVTKIEVQNDGVTFHVLSDPFDDGRYRGVLKFPFVRGQKPSADQIVATVAEVLKPDQSAAVADSGQQPAGPADGAPHPVETKTIALGQTKDQVIQTFGPPNKVVQLGTKEIDYYSDMKVTFVKNVVTNVE